MTPIHFQTKKLEKCARNLSIPGSRWLRALSTSPPFEWKAPFMPWAKVLSLLSWFLHLNFISAFLFVWNALELQGKISSPQIFLRVLVTQLKYFKDIISANISAGDWSHSSNIQKILFQQIFLQGFRHTAQIFQKYYFSKYILRGFHHTPQIF